MAAPMVPTQPLAPAPDITSNPFMSSSSKNTSNPFLAASTQKQATSIPSNNPFAKSMTGAPASAPPPKQVDPSNPFTTNAPNQGGFSLGQISNPNSGHSSKSKGGGSGVAGGSGATGFPNVGGPNSIFNTPPPTNGSGQGGGGLFQQPSSGNMFGANAGSNP